jgi:hypothetical protein
MSRYICSAGILASPPFLRAREVSCTMHVSPLPFRCGSRHPMTPPTIHRLLTSLSVVRMTKESLSSSPSMVGHRVTELFQHGRPYRIKDFPCHLSWFLGTYRTMSVSPSYTYDNTGMSAFLYLFFYSSRVKRKACIGEGI